MLCTVIQRVILYYRNHETSWNRIILFSVSLSVSFCMFLPRYYLHDLNFTLQGNPHKLLFSHFFATETILLMFVLQIYYVLRPIFGTIFLQSLFWWEFKENCLLIITLLLIDTFYWNELLQKNTHLSFK